VDFLGWILWNEGCKFIYDRDLVFKIHLSVLLAKDYTLTWVHNILFLEILLIFLKNSPC
jgi:hypothetical protein